MRFNLSLYGALDAMDATEPKQTINIYSLRQLNKAYVQSWRGFLKMILPLGDGQEGSHDGYPLSTA